VRETTLSGNQSRAGLSRRTFKAEASPMCFKDHQEDCEGPPGLVMRALGHSAGAPHAGDRDRRRREGRGAPLEARDEVDCAAEAVTIDLPPLFVRTFVVTVLSA
jgi:hypothetical protein